MISLKTPEEIAKMREAGRIVARTMRIVSEAIEPGKSTELELDALAESVIRESGGIPSFKGYRGFPNAACISTNEVVVHGIPTDRVLKEGDIISLDFGVILDGWHADSAWTFPVGEISDEARRLMSVTKEAMNQGIAQCRKGRRMGDVSSTIQRYVEQNNCSVVRELVGHGIGRSLHEPPNVPNFGKPKKGVKIQPGMTFCVEPMVNAGTHKVNTLEDDWTVVTADGTLSAHYEHTVAVTENGPELLTVE